MRRLITICVHEWMRVVSGMLAVFLLTTVAQAADPKVEPVPGPPALLLSGFDLTAFGYSTEEFFVSGTATSYKLLEHATPTGNWNAVPAESEPYKTRIVVVRPTDPSKFNSTVVVEWLNVTAGTDASPDWNMTHREILRSGYAYVAVSAQKVGIDGAPAGGMVMGTALKKQNPERYGSLNHPGDAYSYDIYSQAGMLIRAKGTASTLLGRLEPKRVLSIGESQSAAFLTTYINAVDPIAKVYDGFLVHSRFGGAASLQSAAMAGGQDQPRTIQFRRDLRVPLIAVETETDVLDGRMPGYRGARQGDHERLRVWEVPGTAHADNYSFVAGMMDSGSIPIEKLAAAWAPMSEILGMKLAKPINNAPQHHYVVQNALVALDRWVAGEKVPPKAAPMKTKAGEGDAPATFVLDAKGLTEGGVRTPWVDVPISRLSGSGNSGSPLAFLAGSSEPFDAATLDRFYPGGKKEYLKKFEASLDLAIKSGFILPADRKEILELAALGYHGAR
jgi:hypothetical protein